MTLFDKIVFIRILKIKKKQILCRRVNLKILSTPVLNPIPLKLFSERVISIFQFFLWNLFVQLRFKKSKQFSLTNLINYFSSFIF